MNDKTTALYKTLSDFNCNIIACAPLATRLYHSAKPAPTEAEYDRRIEKGDDVQQRVIENARLSNAVLTQASKDHMKALEEQSLPTGKYPNVPKPPRAYSDTRQRARTGQ